MFHPNKKSGRGQSGAFGYIICYNVCIYYIIFLSIVNYNYTILIRFL